MENYDHMERESISDTHKDSQVVFIIRLFGIIIISFFLGVLVGWYFLR
jgi:hypothetical protein